jgi:hypothetical protein
MQNISGFGLQINCIASTTFPVGFLITEFADDSDPFDLPSLQVADSAMGLNGDQIVWSKANPIKTVISVIPGSFSDVNLNILLQANRPGRGKFPALDTITMTGIYPDGSFVTLINGVITDGIPGKAVASAGRIKTRTYNFSFEGIISV